MSPSRLASSLSTVHSCVSGVDSCCWECTVTRKQQKDTTIALMTPLSLRAGGDLILSSWTTRTLRQVIVTSPTPLKTTVEQHGRTSIRSAYSVRYLRCCRFWRSFVRNNVRLQLHNSRLSTRFYLYERIALLYGTVCSASRCKNS